MQASLTRWPGLPARSWTLDSQSGGGPRYCPVSTKAARPFRGAAFAIKNVRRCPTLPQGLPCSTIGAEGLNFRVRNGTGCFPFAMAAVTLWNYCQGYPAGCPRGSPLGASETRPCPGNRTVDASSCACKKSA